MSEQNDKKQDAVPPYMDDVGTQSSDPDKRTAPAAQRNTQPIMDVLAPLLPDRGRVLEVASGTGQHVVTFAQHFPGIKWHPSDPHPVSRKSIAA